jgi:hypothetical protein
VFGLLGEPGKVPLETQDLVGKAEEIVMGEGRLWEKKLQTQIVTVGGLPAYDGTYEGPDTRGRLVIARGEEIDLVFFFRAWRDRYASLVPVFDDILTSFQWQSGRPTRHGRAPVPHGRGRVQGGQGPRARRADHAVGAAHHRRPVAGEGLVGD